MSKPTVPANPFRSQRNRRQSPEARIAPQAQPSCPQKDSSFTRSLNSDLDKMSRECYESCVEVQKKFESRMADLFNELEGDIRAISQSAHAIQERRAKKSIEVLGQAFDAGRQDERVRILELEDERKRKMILHMQREINMMRGESEKNIGWDKERYFRALGKNLGEVATELQDIGEKLQGSEDVLARVSAVKLEMMGEQIGEFADNSLCYADEAKEQVAKQKQ